MPSTEKVVSAATRSAAHLAEGQGVEVDRVFRKHNGLAGHVNACPPPREKDVNVLQEVQERRNHITTHRGRECRWQRPREEPPRGRATPPLACSWSEVRRGARRCLQKGDGELGWHPMSGAGYTVR